MISNTYERCSPKGQKIMSNRSTSIFKDPHVVKHMSLFHDKYVIVSTDKAPNNIVFVCISHYLIMEFGIDNSLGNPTFTFKQLELSQLLCTLAGCQICRPILQTTKHVGKPGTGYVPLVTSISTG